MRRTALPLLPLALLLAACGATTVDTNGLTRVQISSSQALPPPYGQAQVTLTSPSSLAQFATLVSDNHIGIASTTNSSGCAGGIQYTVVVVARSATTNLSAYDCGGQITGNLSGNASGFLAGLSTLLPATG